MKKIDISGEGLCARFHRILDEHIFQGVEDATRGVSLPGFGKMVFASGMADLASNTKTFVAAVILQLAPVMFMTIVKPWH